jgi:hypothetical protein
MSETTAIVVDVLSMVAVIAALVGFAKYRQHPIGVLSWIVLCAINITGLIRHHDSWWFDHPHHCVLCTVACHGGVGDVAQTPPNWRRRLGHGLADPVRRNQRYVAVRNLMKSLKFASMSRGSS